MVRTNLRNPMYYPPNPHCDQLEGDAFLNTLTAALHDPNPRWSLDEIVRYTVAHEEIELVGIAL
jgi:hypothetical protein